MRRLSFDPRQPGHLKAVVEVGNPEYYRTRAAELILDRTGSKVTNLENAITLLSLALWYEENPS